MNVQVDSLVNDSDRKLEEHRKFKQIIGYRELKNPRNLKRKPINLTRQMAPKLSPLRASVELAHSNFGSSRNQSIERRHNENSSVIITKSANQLPT